MNSEFDPEIRMIPVKHIIVLNPRSRGKKKFAQIVANIAKLGLKRPVTVSPAESKNGHQMYYLVCGQGRLESYIELGEEVIPAIVIQGSKEELLLMSLAVIGLLKSGNFTQHNRDRPCSIVDAWRRQMTNGTTRSKRSIAARSPRRFRYRGKR